MSRMKQAKIEWEMVEEKLLQAKEAEKQAKEQRKRAMEKWLAFHRNFGDLPLENLIGEWESELAVQIYKAVQEQHRQDKEEKSLKVEKEVGKQTTHPTGERKIARCMVCNLEDVRRPYLCPDKHLHYLMEKKKNNSA